MQFEQSEQQYGKGSAGLSQYRGEEKTTPLEKLFFTPEKIENEESLLAQSIAEISASGVVAMMLKEAREQKWSIGFSLLHGPDFHLDIPEKQIILESNGSCAESLARMPYFYHALQLSLIRALRDVWQEKRHGGFDEEYAPESILMLERVRAADRDAVAILCAWELKSAGNPALWRHIMGTEYSDMARSFSSCIERNISMLPKDKPLAAAFSKWFRDEGRVNRCDHETLEYMDTVMASYPGNPFGLKLAGRICVEKLSCLPDKTAYLQGQGEEILKAPLYAGLGDALNQSHFLHIMRDTQVFIVQNVPFRDGALAEKIFPGGMMTPEG